MDKFRLNVINVTGEKFCTEPEDGQKVFEQIDKAFKENKFVVVSFMNIEMLTTAFLNTAIGQLYRDYSEEIIREKLSVEQMTPAGLVSLKRVVDTAKIFYKNPDALRNSINDILEE